MLEARTHLVNLVRLVVQSVRAATHGVRRPLDSVFAQQATCLLEIALCLLVISRYLLTVESRAELVDVSIRFCVESAEFTVVRGAGQGSRVHVWLYDINAFAIGDVAAEGVLFVWSVALQDAAKRVIAPFSAATISKSFQICGGLIVTYSSMVYVAPWPRAPA